MKVAFICVNYNNFSLTKKFVDCINLLNGNDKISIIISDNNSGQSDIEGLKKMSVQKNMQLILNKENIGYFKGLNKGLEAIDVKNYDFVIIGNNDLYFNQDFLDILSKKKIEDNIFAIAPNIIRPDGIHQNPHVINKFNIVQRLYRRIYFMNYYSSIIVDKIYNIFRDFINNSVDRKNNDKIMPILMGYGACYILTSNFFKKFDNLDAPNFLMGEEAVLANQILKGKGKIMYIPDLIVNHVNHSSIGKISKKELYKYSKESYKYYLKYLKEVQ